MIDKNLLASIVSQAKEKSKKRNFKQSVELYIILDSHRVKVSDININEVISLPNKLNSQSSVCAVAPGELGLRAKRAGADIVIAQDEIDRLSTNKREAKKLAKEYDFFIADTTLMPRIGKTLGPYLGPKGKMPIPITLNSPVDQIIQRLKGSIRSRTRGHNAISCKIGEEDMEDEKLVNNALAVIESIEKKIPGGLKSIKSVGVKLTMGPIETVLYKGD
ncbi:MAG: 50S ribosomal protein L1 [Conexivisphaerales archaeon]